LYLSERTDISIVIVNYNVKDFLLECLRSIESASKGLDIETIVVDNNSSDGSVEFLEPLFPQVTFIKAGDNLGFGKANNIGIKRAKGKYLLILNPDTLLEQNTLHAMFEYMEQNPGIGIAGCKVLNPDGTFQSACRRGFPTPWASFCKLFGLQKLFPKSTLFGKYNPTVRDENESYYVDAVIGAFMFCRTELIKEIGGFDEKFFMYGEDLDMCYRVQKAGYKVGYFSGATIIHYKGESSKRSSINEVKHFYQAMEIFAKKHFSHSALFLLFLRLGIVVRAGLAYLNKNKLSIGVMLFDLVIINLAMMVGTSFKFDSFFGFPSHAYPTVFIVVTLVLLTAGVAVGEYFEGKPSFRKSLLAIMVSFFVLSSLTYFFKDYAFSRGVVLVTIAFTLIFSFLARAAISFYERISGSRRDRKILFVGNNEKTSSIIDKLTSAETFSANIVGIVANSPSSNTALNYPILGSLDYLHNIINENEIEEVIITDDSIDSTALMKIVSSQRNDKVRFHVAQEYEELLAARIINEITGSEPTLPNYNLSKFRYRFIKRLSDISISIFLLTLGIPLVYLLFGKTVGKWKNLFNVLIGKYSFIGLYKTKGSKNSMGKPGLIGLAHISRPERLSEQSIENLNDYYLRNFNLSLDVDIFIKYLFRK